MKADELTLGDHVQVNGEVCKVISISYFDIGISDSKEDFYHEHIDNIKPVPLTAEILEKNFTRQSRYAYEDCTDDFEVRVTGYTDGVWTVSVDIINGELPTWQMYVGEVHELQHALRLCGVDKKIEL